MATRLFFHQEISGVTGTLPPFNQSVLTPNKAFDFEDTVHRSMDTTKGSAQTSVSTTALSSTSARIYYVTRFISVPLTTTSISANTWTYNFAVAEDNLATNFPVTSTSKAVNVTAYVWRPSTGTFVGYISSGNSAANYSEPSAINTETSEHGTFTGSAVTCQAGDVIVIEPIFSVTMASTGSGRNMTFYYDGATETTSTGTTVSNHASFLETPQTLAFQTWAPAITSPSDNFEPNAYTLVERQFSPNGKWQCRMAQNETNSVSVETDAQNGTKAMHFHPTASNGAAEIHSSLVYSRKTYQDFDLSVDVKTVSQLRFNATPNHWEMAWIMWNRPVKPYVLEGGWDDYHYYGFTLYNDTGGQLEKKDNNVGDDLTGEIYLAFPTTPTYVFNTWQRWRIRFTNSTTTTPRTEIWIDGNQILDYTDNDGAIPRNTATMQQGGAIVMYCEDSHVAYDNFVVTTLPIASRSVSDTTTLSESTARHSTLRRTASDTKTLSESNARHLTLKRSLTDTKTLSESTSRALKLKRLPSDTISLNEALDSFFIPGGVSNLRETSDSTTTSESIIRSRILVPRTPSDTVTKSESIARHLILKRLNTDSTTLSESNIRRLTLKRLLSDTKTLSESNIRRKTAIRLLSDTVTKSESLARHIILRRTLSDTKTLSDSLSRVLTSIRRPSDTTTLSEDLDIIVGTTVIRTLEDTITLSESLVRASQILRTILDTTTKSESLNIHLLRLMQPTDTTTLSESLSRTLLARRTISDTSTLSESTIPVRLQARTISDTINASESLLRLLTLRRVIEDTKALSESIESSQLLIRTPVDNISLSESIDTPTIGHVIRTISDTVSQSDSIFIYSSYKVFITDNISTSESISRSRTAIRRAEDFIGHIRYKRHIINSVTLSESIQTIIRPLKHLVSDTITLSESISVTVIPRTVQHVRRPEDTITLSEILSRNLTLSRNAAESMLQRSDPAAEDTFFGAKRRVEQEQKIAIPEPEVEPKKNIVIETPTENSPAPATPRHHSLFGRRSRRKSEISL